MCVCFFKSFIICSTSLVILINHDFAVFVSLLVASSVWVCEFFCLFLLFFFVLFSSSR